MRAVAFVGFKKSGKTTAVEAVAKVLKEKGYRVAVAKSMHADFDREGSDTWKFSRIADTVVVRAHDTDAVLFRAGDVNALFSMVNADFLLLEGFKSLRHVPKVICARDADEVRELNDGLAIAVSGVIASTGVGEVEGLPVIDATKEPEKLADIVERRAFMLPNIDCGMCGFKCAEMARMIVNGEKTLKDCVVLSQKPKVTVKIDGQILPMKDWVQELVEKTIRGMLSSMKGYREGKRIEIVIREE
ncbi:molybdopterin-guanine dinucleotide biosynthesis protein MobB [Thermococcus thioreducens]|uniref:Molybdopterin-guanine dinucleotide biosynthesis protein B n=1 Tax=Thermococcus thioreducens TaxID=277988 RepID=A0A0Q2M0T2_9EURY|nr:molybdopterin-guanine dinucleotide biosynthesis protein MobB [Thermococcus thioreducens]ASJ12971.1 molybdopterin-guanine dinucleotide biosynthesis protein MobB [Thermococcus thioreducens]KQH81482.1 molybdopterin-guanine dinucleotide biosynthesis protein MobB [Thermococcus thioreducens]SEV82760.1 molybdopterin-guanine dinucleotide biosynthesis protein B [Thermococcus thioreducens]